MMSRGPSSSTSVVPNRTPRNCESKDCQDEIIALSFALARQEKISKDLSKQNEKYAHRIKSLETQVSEMREQKKEAEEQLMKTAKVNKGDFGAAIKTEVGLQRKFVPKQIEGTRQEALPSSAAAEYSDPQAAMDTQAMRFLECVLQNSSSSQVTVNILGPAGSTINVWQ